MEKKSPHILNASSGLLGFCLVILTSLELSKVSNGTIIDELAGIASLFLAASCFLSFLAIRCRNEKREKKYETGADYLFMAALILIALAVVLVTFNLF